MEGKHRVFLLRGPFRILGRFLSCELCLGPLREAQGVAAHLRQQVRRADLGLLRQLIPIPVPRAGLGLCLVAGLGAGPIPELALYFVLVPVPLV